MSYVKSCHNTVDETLFSLFISKKSISCTGGVLFPFYKLVWFWRKITITKISLKLVLNLCLKQMLKIQLHIVVLFIRSGIYDKIPFPGNRSDRGNLWTAVLTVLSVEWRTAGTHPCYRITGLTLLPKSSAGWSKIIW